MPYRTLWVYQKDRITELFVQPFFPCPEIDAVLNDLEREGCSLHTIVPGRKSGSDGVYITLQRP